MIDQHMHPHDDLAAFAVDALEPRERLAVEAHLAECPACRQEVDVHLATVARLTTAETAPPPDVWDRIAGELPGARPAPSNVRPMRPTWRRPRWLLAAAAVVVIVLGIAVWAPRSDDPAPVAELAADAAADPDARVVTLRSDDGSPAARVVLTDDVADYVMFDAVQSVPTDRSLQLWDTGNPRSPVSLGVLGTGDGGAVQLVLPDDTSSFALSVEPAGGVVAPTGPVVARG